MDKLGLIFTLQAGNMLTKWFAVICWPSRFLIQVYFNSRVTYLLMRKLKVPHIEDELQRMSIVKAG